MKKNDFSHFFCALLFLVSMASVQTSESAEASTMLTLCKKIAKDSGTTVAIASLSGMIGAASAEASNEWQIKQNAPENLRIAHERYRYFLDAFSKEEIIKQHGQRVYWQVIEHFQRNIDHAQADERRDSRKFIAEAAKEGLKNGFVMGTACVAITFTSRFLRSLVR